MQNATAEVLTDIRVPGRPLSDVNPYIVDPFQDEPHPDPDDQQAVLERAARDRVYFCEHCHEMPDGELMKLEPWQKRAMWALDGGETRISIRSGHGVGKTTFAALLAEHFILFRRHTKIPVTAPSGSQMKDGLIPELRLWIGRLKFSLGELIEIQQQRVILKEDPANNFISFRTARLENPEALQGIHAENVLVICDEASGVPEPIYEAARGTMSTPSAIFVLIGNPTKAKGMFYRTHHTLKDLWWTLRVSCEDSSRVSADFIEEMRRTYTEYSNQWRIRVLGEFPEGDDDSVIPRWLAEGALHRDVAMFENPDIYWGLDPGRGGDPSGFIERSGNYVTDAQEYHFADTMKVVGVVKDRWDSTNAETRPKVIFVDSIGLGGPIADRLRQLGLPVMDINVGEATAMKTRFPKLRAELWYAVRDWLDRKNVKFACRNDYALKLVEELVAPDEVITDAGKTDVESKRSMRSRGVSSPNLADALCLTFGLDGGMASGAVGAEVNGFGVHDWSRAIRKPLKGVF